MFQKEARSLRFGLPLCLILVPFLGHAAEPYWLEVHGGFSRIDTHRFVNTDQVRQATDASSDGFELVGQYFFRPIDPTRGPLREADFLERASTLRLSVAATRENSEGRATSSLGESWGRSISDSRTTDYHVQYRFVAPERPWIGIAGYGYADRATEGFSAESWWTDEKHTNYSVGIGRYVGPQTAVIAEYGRLHSELDSRPVIAGPPDGQPAVSLPLSYRFEILAVEVRTLLRLGSRQHLGLTAAWQKTSATSANAVYPYDGSYEVGVTYYPRGDVSVALSAGRDYAARSMLPDRRRYLLEANWFATRSLAFGLGYESTDSRIRSDAINFLGAGGDSDGLRFSVSWRY